MTPKFKEGTIVVATRKEATGCGIEYIRKGSIIEVADEVCECDYYANVYRNRREKERNDTHTIDVEKLRVATKAEADCYGKGIYYVDQVPSTSQN